MSPVFRRVFASLLRSRAGLTFAPVVVAMVLVAGIATSVNMAARRSEAVFIPLPRAEVLVYGPESFTIPSGGSALHVEEFDVTYQPGARYRIDIENGDGGSDEVDAALLTVNGVQLHSGSLPGGLTSVEFFGLLANNEMVLDLDGPNGAYVEVSIVQLDKPTTTIFGPVELIRTNGPPNEDTYFFDLPEGVEAPFGLHLNSGFSDGSSRATAAWVDLNSEPVFGPGDFGQDVGYLEAEINPGDSANVLELRIAGRRGSRIEVFVTAVVADTSAPVLTITAPEAGLITSDDSVTVTGVAVDQSALTVDVNGVNASVVDDSLYSARVALEDEGLNVITVTATDASSNEAVATVTVTRDNTAPSLVVAAPVDELVTALTPTPLLGSAVDVNGADVNVNGNPVLTDTTGAFADSVDLDPGVNVLMVTATDPAGNQAVEVRTVTLDQDDPFLVVEDPEDGLVTNDPEVTVSGSVTDATAVTIDANAVPLVVTAGLFEGEITLAEGPNLVTVTATDAAGNEAQVQRSVTVDTEAPLLVVDEPTDGSTTTADSVDVSGTVSDATEVMLTLNAVGIPIVLGAFDTRVALAPGPNVLAFLAVDEAGNESVDTVNVTRGDGLPPDPSLVASVLPANVVSTIGAATAFLYEGPDSIQTGVAPGTIDHVRVVVVRGRVLDTDSVPVTGAVVSIAGHAEFGQTLTRTDGAYDLALNGGGVANVRFRKAGYPEVQRRIELPWQDYVVLDDVVMTPLDTAVTTIEFTDPIEIARGTPQTDADGTRQSTLMFRQGTVATIDTGSGLDTLASISVRTTEYTVGGMGEAAMPAELPPTSGYTYAVELSVDEAIAADADRVEFSQPVSVYVENFLDFPVGLAVPNGYFDRTQGEWLAERDGRVIAVVDTAGGVATLNIDSVAGAESSAVVAAQLGITEDELEAIAATYAPGDELWRVEAMHFSARDKNFPVACLATSNCVAPDTVPPSGPDARVPNDRTECGGSIVCVESQSLGERIPVVGTALSLNYSSLRVPGRKAAYTLEIPLTGDTVPTDLLRVEVEITVAGRKFHLEFPPDPEQSHTFVWDGLDAYGRELAGRHPVKVVTGYAYAGRYQRAAVVSAGGASFGAPSGGGGGGALGILSVPARLEVLYTSTWRGYIGGWSVTGADPRAQSLGGWTLDVHHGFDPVGASLYLGDGTDRTAAGIGEVIETTAGNGLGSFDPNDTDGEIANRAPMPSPRGVAVARDGTVAVLLAGRVWQIGSDGIVTHLAGGGTSSPDSIPADSVNLGTHNLVSMSYGPDGSLWMGGVLSGGSTVYRVWPDGIIEQFNGPSMGDGGFLRDDSVGFNRLAGVAAGPDGSVYVLHGSGSGLQCFGGTCRRVRRIAPDQRVSTIAGTGASCVTFNVNSCGNGGPATSAGFEVPRSLAAGPDGSVYISDNGIIRRIAPDGFIHAFAGNGNVGYTGDGGAALDAFIDPFAMVVGADGTLYFSQGNHGVVRKVDPRGVISTVAGTGVVGYSGDGGRALAARLRRPSGLALDYQGGLLIADVDDHRVRRVGIALPGFDAGEHLIASSDGSQVYRFNAAGLHLETISALTGETLYSFKYDSLSRLEEVIDADSLVTTITRNGSGEPETITGPFGQETTLTVDGFGYLASIANPANETHSFVTDSLGLLEAFITPLADTTAIAYDTGGRLIEHTDPAGRVTTLTRSDSATFYEVEMTRGTRVSTYRVEQTAEGGVRRVVTDPAGNEAETIMGADSETAGASPDGTERTSVTGPDFRFGLEAPVVTSATLGLPSGLTSVLQGGRRVQLADTLDPLSLVSVLDSALLNGRKYTSAYDAATRTLMSTTPEGRETVSVLDSLERLVSREVAGLETVEFTYDGDGLLTAVTQGARTWTFDYDAAGRLLAATDPLARTDSLYYDLADRVRRQVLANGDSIDYAYDANGNLTSLAPPGRPAHAFTYNAVGLDSIYDPPDVSGLTEDRTRYHYNGERELVEIVRPDSALIEFAYDSAGRVDEVTIPRGTLDYAYSATTGQLTGITAPGTETLTFTYDGVLPTQETWSGTVDGIVAFDYDADLRLSGLAVNGDTIPYAYDDDGLLTNAGDLVLTRDPLNGLLTETELDSVRTRTMYNGFGEPVADSAWVGSTLVFARNYERDDLGRIEQVVDLSDGVTTIWGYGYDELGRLETVTQDSTAFASYVYDANGNRLSRTSGLGIESGTYDVQDRLISYDGATFGYTPAGELLRKVEGTDTTRYDYDALGNLTEVELPDGTVIEYVIDGRNRRIGRLVDGQLLQGLLYGDQLNPVAELDSTGAVVARFVYGSKANVPDFVVRGGSTYRVISDHLGSVRLVLNASTGAVAQRLTYDEWGRVLEDTNPGFQPFGFSGGIWDEAIELVRFGARDYDAGAGRWTTRDPIGFEGGSSDLFEYVHGNPTNLIDEGGTGPTLDACKAGIDKFFRGPLEYARHWARRLGAAGPCEQRQARIEDELIRESLKVLRDYPEVRERALDAVSEAVRNNRAFVACRLGTALGFGVVFGLPGSGFAILASYGNAHIGVENLVDVGAEYGASDLLSAALGVR